MAAHREIVIWIHDWAEVAFADLGPEVYEPPDWFIALFALAEDRLHDNVGVLGSCRLCVWVATNINR